MDKMTLRRIGWIGASLGLTTALVGCNDMQADSSTSANHLPTRLPLKAQRTGTGSANPAARSEPESKISNEREGAPDWLIARSIAPTNATARHSVKVKREVGIFLPAMR